MFSKADNYMSGGSFQSASSCGKYPYIGDSYLQKNLILLHILWNTEKSFLMLHFLAFHWQGLFVWTNTYWNFLRKSFVTFFSGRFDVHLQVIQPILKIPYLISFIKHPKYVIWNKKITEKNAISGLHWNGSDKTPHFIDICFRCIIWTLLNVFTCT